MSIADLNLDHGIREYVEIFVTNGFETFESCEGGVGHSFPEPTIRFYGDASEGVRATYIALKYNLPIFNVKRVYDIIEREIQSPVWEIVFLKSENHQNIGLDKESCLFTRSSQSLATGTQALTASA